MPSEVKNTGNKKAVAGFIAYVAVFFSLILISYNRELNLFLGEILSLFRPVLIGLAIAYLCNPIFRFLERRIFFRVRPAAFRRVLSLLLTYLLVLAVIAFLILLILPQLVNSIIDFVTNYQAHVDEAVKNINGMFESLNGIFATFTDRDDFFKPIDGSQFFDTAYRIFVELLAQINVSSITNAAGIFITVLKDSIFALFISIYLLASKEKRYAQVMKLRHALFDDLTNKRISKLCTTADNMFGKFLEGKFLDSFLVGVLTYAVISIFRIPYAILISSMIAITTVIPIVGFLIGFIPASLLVLLTDAEHFFPFLIIMFVIYQIDVNVISPKILGTNTGVSSLCVIVSICIFGTLWGFVGMILAVPLAATILDLLDGFLHHRLQKKRLPDDVENYYAPDPIVDPIRGMTFGPSRLLHRLEKKVLHATSLIENGLEERLTHSDRLALRIYRVCRKWKIVRETSHESLVQFSAEEAERRVATEAIALRATLSRHSFAEIPTTASDEAQDCEKGEIEQ